MSRRLWRRASTVILFQAVLASVLAGTAWAQSTVDPQRIEFIPSDSNATILPDGRPAISGYEVEIAAAGTTQVLQRLALGKPPADPDGMIRANFANSLTVALVPGAS